MQTEETHKASEKLLPRKISATQGKKKECAQNLKIAYHMRR